MEEADFVMESSEHRELVAELARAIGRRWPQATVYWDSGWAICGARRVAVGRYIPDVVATDQRTGRIVAIGEAKRWDDIKNEHTERQLKGWLREKEVPICLTMSRGYQEDMEDAIELATGVERGGRIYIYDGLKWWTRQRGTLGVWRHGQ